ncbi:hypothetical protein [Campylobacter sp. VTCC 70190]
MIKNLAKIIYQSSNAKSNQNILHSNQHLGAGLITGTLSGVKEDKDI